VESQNIKIQTLEFKIGVRFKSLFMPRNWDGKTKGSLTGYKIFIFMIKHFGLRSAYFLLLFVSFWFVLFSMKGSRAQYELFRKRLKYNFVKSIFSIWRNNFVFGMVLIDKTAILSGLKYKFSTEHTNAEVIEHMIKNKTGGILLNAHIGSWEAAGQLLERYGGTISIVMYDEEHKKIKDYLSNVESEAQIEIIPLKEDGSHLIKIAEILNNKGIIVMHGDRYTEGTSTFEHEFLGEKANFPSGPYHLAAKFGVPITFATAFREKNKHYHFYAMPPITIDYPGDIMKRKEEIYNKSKIYIKELERMIRKYPLQWFNYYPFWGNQ
jgi:predicted LPLAT superfamily acyltransferase